MIPIGKQFYRDTMFYCTSLCMLMVIFSSASANPMKNPKICGRPTCSDATKFKYNSDKTYNYQYSVDIQTLFGGTSKNESTFHAISNVALKFPTPCEGVLQLSDIVISDGKSEAALPKSEDFSKAVSEFPLRFSFNDGMIPEVCPENSETSWVLNFKKGILSSFQNSMKRFDVGHQTEETDVNGNCLTQYALDRAENTSLIITKTKNFSTCINRYKHHSILQTTPYVFRSNYQALPIIKSRSMCNLSVDNNIYNKIDCEEVHIFQPFSHGDSGAKTITRQKFLLISEDSTSDIDLKDITRRQNLLFDHNLTPKPTSGELRASRDLIKLMCTLSIDDVQPAFPDAFTKFIHTARLLSYPALTQLYIRSSSLCTSGRKHILDALPLLGSNAAFAVMRDLIISQSVSKDVIHEWLFILAFVPRPDLTTISAISPLLLDENADAQYVLSVSSVVHTYCKWNDNCENEDEILNIISYLENQLLLGCQPPEKGRAPLNKTLIALKALANIGVRTSSLNLALKLCIENQDLPMEIKIASIEAHRRFPCEENRGYFLETYRNQDIDPELRIAAYLQVMRCANYVVIKTIKHSLQEEDVNQVGSYVWSHLHNLLKSSIPSRVEIQGLLQDKDLGKKFSSDVRKFSHNYEGSLFFDEYNAGGNFESNVIFSPKSYIPRSAMLNVTIDLFGESINVFEVTGRIEGFEHYLEAAFGPKGPLSSQKVTEGLQKLRILRSTDSNLQDKVSHLPNVIDNNFDQPQASLGMKVFGNELKYHTFVGDNEIQKAVSSINPVEKLKQLLSGKEMNYNKAAVFLDTSYVVPTGTGLPIDLNAVGTVAINLKLSGSLKVADFRKTGELDVKGNVRPSVSLDVTGTMGVDAYYAGTGIKLKTNLYTSSAIDGQLKIRGKRLVSVSFNLPKDKTEIITAQSELVVMNGEVEELQSGIQTNRVDKHMCSWPSLDQTLGLNVCADLQFPNATEQPTASKFLLNGPTKFGLSMQKADPSAKQYLLEYKWETQENATYVSLVFDTPGSNLKRELSAKLNLDTNSQNLTLLIQSAKNKYEALGKYKNSPNQKYIHFGLDINGKKHVDAELSLLAKEEKYGFKYQPRLYLAINGTRIAELSGTLRWVEKKGVSQCDVNLEFQTRKLETKLFGYVKRSEATVSANLKLDYQFKNARIETVKLIAKLSNRSSKSLTRAEGNLELESSAYPHFNFISSLSYLSTHGHLECKLEISYGLNIKDERNKLTLQLTFTYAKSYESSKVNVLVQITKPISDIDLKFSLSYHAANPDVNVRAIIRYATGKDINISLDLKLPRSSLTFMEAKLNVTLPAFNPMIIELQLHEKTPNEYTIQLAAIWFSGHNLTAQGLYQDRSTSKASSHTLKLLIRSPSFKEINLICKYHQDEMEFKIDVQGDHDKDKYYIILKHASPSSVEFETYIELRIKSSVYTLSTTINLLQHKQVVIDLHLDQIRDIHITLRGLNERRSKEAGIEIKWDANRDPGQKIAASVQYAHPENMNYNANFLISYPGRTVKSGYVLAVKGSMYESSAYLEWSPIEMINVKVGAVYQYEESLLLSFKSELLTPFENWKRTSLSGGIRHKQNLFHANASVFWQDNQNVALNLFGDYFMSNENFSCEFNASILSTIPQVSSMSGSLFHMQGDKKYDTNVHLQYYPEKIISVKSTWELEESPQSANLTGKISLISPYAGYREGVLLSRMHISSDWDVKGVSDITIDRRRYTLSINGHIKRITNCMLEFNITTPLPNYGVITGRFGYTGDKKHLVAEIKWPNGAIGVEILFSFFNTKKFDIKFNLATPIEFLQKALLIAKLNEDMADFRCGWNNLVIGFSALWHYANSTDFEYCYRIYTPIEGFHENGVIAKLIRRDGIDFQLGINLGDMKLGVKLQGAPKPPVSEDIKLANRQLTRTEDDSSDMDIDDDEDLFTWKGLIEIDTFLYQTMKGVLDIDEKDSLYTIFGSLTLPDGTADLYDEFYFEDVFTITNKLSITTPCELFKEVKSNFDLKIDFGSEYRSSFDLLFLSNKTWINSGLGINYTEEQGEDIVIHSANFNLFTPFNALKLFNASGVLEIEEENIYRTNISVATSQSHASLAVNLEAEEGYLEASVGLCLKSPVYTIPTIKLTGRKDYTQPERKLELMFEILEPTLEKYKVEALWQLENNTYLKTGLKIETPLEALPVAEVSLVVTEKKSANILICNIMIMYTEEFKIDLNFNKKDNIISVDMNSSLEQCRTAHLTGTLSGDGVGPKSLKASLKCGKKSYILSGSLQSTNEAPLLLETRITPSHEGEEEILFSLTIQRNNYGYVVSSSIKQGKENIHLQGDVSMKSTLDSSFNFKVTSTHHVHKSFSVSGRFLQQDNGNLTTELSADTCFKGFEKIMLSGNLIPQKESGAVNAAFDIRKSRGSLNIEWIWIFMKDMNIKINGSFFDESISKEGAVQLFYRNPKNKFKEVSLGVDVNLNKDTWQFGTNTTLSIESSEKVDLLFNLKLPAPQHEVHTLVGQLYHTKKFESFSGLLKYHTLYSNMNYGVSGKGNVSKEEIMGDMIFQYGIGESKNITNVLNIKNSNTSVDVVYTLNTPHFEEATFKSIVLYKKYYKFNTIRVNLFHPAGHNIAGGEIDFSSIVNLNGTVRTNTPFQAFPYAGLHFKAATESVHHQRFVEVFWPNNTALFYSNCTYNNLQLNTQFNGSILVEIPLATRHIGKVNYGYKEEPLHKTGHASVEYNGNKFIEGKYNCNSVSSAGYDQDEINIEVENSYTPFGITYIHEFKYNGGLDGMNFPTVDLKRAAIFKLDNRTAFNLTGELCIKSTFTGQEITLTAIHSDRVVKLTTEYDFLDHGFKQKSHLSLDPVSWASYDLTIVNKTNNDKEEEHIDINFAYPKRNFTLSGYYQIATNLLSSDMTFEWDKASKKKSVGASLDWKRISSSPDKHHAVFCIKHPSFVRDVTLNGLYSSDGIDLVDVTADLVYSNDSNKKVSLSGKLLDTSSGRGRDYKVLILGSHPATRLELKVVGQIKLESRVYQTNNVASYKRSFLPLQTRELRGIVDLNNMELDLESKDQRDVSFVKGKYAGKYPLYQVNGTVHRSSDHHSVGNMYLNFNEKVLLVTCNTTKDTSDSKFYIDGKIPDSRNAVFNVWTDYEDIRLSDIIFYIRLNHSRLVTSKLLWRPELENEMKISIEELGYEIWSGIFNTLEYWKNYIRSETCEAINCIWIDAKPIVQGFLDDVSELETLRQDVEDFKVYLNNSYNANEFYIKDIVGIGSYLIDELAIRGHIESLPDIINEIWEIMGESGEAIRKSLLWIIETIKNSYKKAIEFLNSFVRGDLTSKLSSLLESLVEKYDKFIKDLHVAFVKYMQELYHKASVILFHHWDNFLQTIEPLFITFAHYVETIVWNVSNELLDFLYQRRNEIVESPYFSKFANFTQDLDKFYKDITKNDFITNVRKYSKILYEFLKEKYLTMVPFGKELQDIIMEIINEFKVLQKLPSINYAIQKYNELNDKIIWLYDYLDLGTKFQEAITLIHLKITDITQTALQAENRYREAKTKFIFDPENGHVLLEQKLPMSWHAFNETPRFEEIPEYKALNDLQNYFVSSNTTFWTLYYEYKPYTEPCNWLPPFKGQAMIAGPQHIMTFDKSFYEFQGSCSYLLASDFVDRNFSLIISYDPNDTHGYYEISVIIDDHIVQVDVFRDTVKLQREGINQLPVEIGDTYIYQEAAMVTIESARGFFIQCNLKFDVCIFSLSGWYFGKTAGLLGTMDNEPRTDFLASDRNITTELGRFAHSWSIDSPKCVSTSNLAVEATHIDPNLQIMCESFFKLKTSQFSTCFARVDSTPFLKMCLNSRDPTGKEPCTIAVAYMQTCIIENTPLRIPDACVKCHLVNGTELTEGSFTQLEGSLSTDIVFLIEARDCNENIKQKRNIDSLISVLTKELTEANFISNRYAVVIFGGDGVYNQPRSIVVNNNIFTTSQQIPQYFDNIPTGKGNRDIFGAIRYAAKLLFRPTVSKTFILLPCSNCDPINMTLDYSVLHQVLLENDIKLHILMNDEFAFQKPKAQKLFYGMDGVTAYTKKDVKNLKGDIDMRRQVKLPKSKLGLCTALALETNGTVFTARRLETEKKNGVKKFLVVLGKRIAKTAVPYPCQTCECTSDNNGMSFMECFPCEYPQPGHYNYDFNEESYIPSNETQGNVDYNYEDESD